MTGSLHGRTAYQLIHSYWDADGPDNVFGTTDDDLRLDPNSPCIDAGTNDADVNTPEVEPFLAIDLELNLRRIDDPATPDTGYGSVPLIDMGAYEFSSAPVPQRIYVQFAAAGAQTGLSWDAAFSTLDIALQTALVAGDSVSEVWVAWWNVCYANQRHP